MDTHYPKDYSWRYFQDLGKINGVPVYPAKFGKRQKVGVQNFSNIYVSPGIPSIHSIWPDQKIGGRTLRWVSTIWCQTVGVHDYHVLSKISRRQCQANAPSCQIRSRHRVEVRVLCDMRV